ncbi:MAG: sigma 54-interacting transcriptional regulator [Rubrivivax sp.]
MHDRANSSATGAARSPAPTGTRRACSEAADGGTLFLDEINNSPMALQAKLLRGARRTAEFYPAGATEPVRVGVRVMLASNVPLPELVEKGLFRKNLLPAVGDGDRHPPLRGGRDDIRCWRCTSSTAIRAASASRPAAEPACWRRVQHDWPGNVRELELVQRMRPLRRRAHQRRRAAQPRRPRAARRWRRSRWTICNRRLEEVEACVILPVLRKTSGDRSRTAEILGIDKSTLWRR